MSQRLSAVRGMEDLYDPLLLRKWRQIETTAQDILTSAGFQEIRTPVLEPAALFERSVGESTEIVEKEMYTLLDRNGRMLAMRPEGTASVVRAFIEHFVTANVCEARLWYGGPMFRYERPQQGRYRQFHQIGAEIFGNPQPWVDAELIALVFQLLQSSGLARFAVHLNSLGSAETRQSYRVALLEFLHTARADLCDDCRRRMQKNPLRVLDCKKDTCIQTSASAPLIVDFLTPTSRKHFEQVREALEIQGIPYRLTPRLVRGLDYYEETVFEFISEELGAQNTVAGGGRYNRLVGELGGPDIAAVGFALGVERVVSLLPEEKVPAVGQPRVYLIGLGEDAVRLLLTILAPLRAREAVVELDGSEASLKAKMRRADRWNADWVVLCGEAELKNQRLVLRHMRDKTQREVSVQELLEKF